MCIRDITGIFKENVFTKLIKEFGDQSERNIPGVLEKTFLAMNTPEGERDGLPKWACDFPYVNGGLFEETISIPKFSKRATRVLKEAAQLDWKEINPDIFGSMIQAVVDTEMRGDLGMHYTSCLLYTSDAADDLLCVDLGGCRIIKKKNKVYIK
eukprot:TRINITY_DN8118_c0_g1_i2.p1 TRINITY_DN8118_c0_g1~~TRINITY_DN8118_c0_g1_i2.p1  ORF type:complete len:170 (+),score=41.05 TRINITY_DN8118_c0_g1_i2:50-511(+)